MRIVTWNCNGAFRKKWHLLSDFHADILIIQECEDPARSNDTAYKSWAENYLWTGESKNKGIGVFARKDTVLESVSMDLGTLKLFLPCRVDSLSLLATWTQQANSPTFEYIGQLWKFLQVHRDFLNAPNAMLIGDLNSNSRWDKWDRWWNHSDVVRELFELGLESAYHKHQCIPQGQEAHPTFYLQRKLEKQYHIDYVFMNKHYNINNVTIGCYSQWLPFSDHMPLFVETT